MKWFFSINEDAPHFKFYIQQLIVAVFSVNDSAGLEPFLLYDGNLNDEISKLERLGVSVIYVRSSIYNELVEISEKTRNPNVMHYGPGVFLRTELPDLSLKLGWKDEYILYTDCDIMFTDLFFSVNLPKPSQYFAVAPESDINNYSQFNSGVMVMHLPSLRKIDNKFRESLKEDLPNSVQADWDQYTYRRFFQDDFERLPPVFNWKPYWGINKEAQIYHFHGPKPWLRNAIRNGTAAPVQIELACDGFWALCKQWDKTLRKALNSIA